MTDGEIQVLGGLLRSLERIEKRLDASDTHLARIDAKLGALEKHVTGMTELRVNGNGVE